MSDVGERAHMEVGAGQMPFKDILEKLKNVQGYGLLLETILTLENDIIIRNPLKATRNSIDFIKANIEKEL